MLSKYKGILLFVKSHKDNDLYIKFLSNTDEIISGLVYGGLSKNKRNIYQIGFFLDFEVFFKNNRPATINAELSKPFISNIIDDKYKLNCLISLVSLINLSIIEGQKVNNIYAISHLFIIKMFSNKRWLNDYFIFLFKLLKIIGYEINYFANKEKKYFDLDTLEFCSIKSSSSVIFPHSLLMNTKHLVNYDSVVCIFKIFETIFIRNHLSDFNLQLPNQYQLFKKIIIDRISIK